MKSVVIITPTTGSKDLIECVDSVYNQTYENVRHLVVVDGEKSNRNFLHHDDQTTCSYLSAADIDYIVLPDNVGGDGWYGHRVFAAMPYLVNEDVVMFLDQDNWLEREHVESMMKTLDKGTQWAYSLRNIVDKEGGWICEDNCESLGKWSIWGTDSNYHIDTSCFAVPREILVRGICGAWYGKWGADRQFFNILKHHYPNFACTGEYTVNYRLAGNQGSVTPEFFLEGNKVMKEHYKPLLYNMFPWELPKDV